jgi:hypothetical protein
MKQLILATIIITIILLSNCKKESSSPDNKVQDIVGYVQKGPFINGSSVTVYDLQSDIAPNGKSYNSVITDKTGSFSFSKISLSSNYVSIRADGFYYNEISGQQSVAQITLYALSDISNKDNVNVNILTHLEKTRVEYLMKKGNTFNDSKVQAQKEVLALFGINKSDIKPSENLNIAESGDDNGVLLAVTSILQGSLSESKLTELLTNISEDIKEDGVLNDSTIGTMLVNQASLLDTSTIRSNLINRYKEIGSQSSIPYFGKYIVHLKDSSGFESTVKVSFPKQGSFGANLLNMVDNSTISSNVSYSITAIQPKDFLCAVRLKITKVEGEGTWSIDNAKSIKWPYWVSEDLYYSEFTPWDSDITVELPIVFANSGSCKFQIDIIDGRNKEVYQSIIKKFTWK